MNATKILVVEDESLVANALRNELEHFGYQVSGIAASGNEAVEKAVSGKPDLVLMDIQLKGGSDGIEAAERIHHRCGIPVVYLSAFSDPGTLDRASKTQAFGYLLKPYEEQELHTTIEMALAKRRAEQQLEETERWLSAIHNSIDEAVIAADRDRRIRFMNPVAARLTGFSATGMVGMPLTAVCNLIDDYDRNLLDDLTDETEGGARTAQLPVTAMLVSKNGHSTPVEGALSSIRDSRGEVLGAVLVLRDITARLETERLHRQSEERMRRVQKMEVVSRLAGGLANHLKNLLKIILDNASLALTDLPEQTEPRELLTRVEGAAQRATELTQRLLAFSLLAGRFPAQFRDVDLGVLLPECINQIRGLIDPQITITFRQGSAPSIVSADEQLLGQAILELAWNTQDAMHHEGQLSIELENPSLSADDRIAHPERQVGDFVRLRVADTGKGMTAAVRARILEPFACGAPSHDCGLGLALVFAVVDQHHGWVECDSEPDGGAHFDIYLPRINTGNF